ncbi:hypothetical protein [Vibrio sp. 10N.247.311.47]|uniref:hypothetical protein n=1 Tax=Vibrio sp. 10N.247.311.47 TaxID=3229988 RepID=UPI00354EB422
MKNQLLLAAIFLTLNGCTSHQYDGMQMDETENGVNYSVEEGTLTVQYQEYQFVPDTKAVLIKCRKTSKKIATELEMNVPQFDYVTERNALLGITSCIAFGDIVEH